MGFFKKLQVTHRKGRELKNRGNRQKARKEMADSSSNISVITLNVNVLNTSIKKQKLAEWIKTTITLCSSVSLKRSQSEKVTNSMISFIYHS